MGTLGQEAPPVSVAATEGAGKRDGDRRQLEREIDQRY
jgi:hypothetical protein